MVDFIMNKDFYNGIIILGCLNLIVKMDLCEVICQMIIGIKKMKTKIQILIDLSLPV